MTTELVPHQPTTDAVDLHRPDLHQWAANLAAAHQIGSALCGTSFAPVHFRGKPDEAAAAILYGSEVGFTPTQALQNLYVIGGKPALYARPMVAIVQANGHRVWTENKSDTSVTVCGQRRGSDHVERETWDIARAKLAGYTSNKKYQTDPQAMLYARAASDICRRIAADALAGMTYSVEEMELAGKEPDTGRPVVAQATASDFGVTAAPHTVPADLEPATAPPGEDVVDAVEVPDETGEQITDAQRRKMFALFGEAGFTTDARTDEGRAVRLEYIAKVIGHDVASSSDLTTDQASAVIESLIADAEVQS